MTDSSSPTPSPSRDQSREIEASSIESDSSTTPPALVQLPEGFSPWEGSSMAVRQGRHWSSSLIWISSFLFGGAVLWAFTAKIDQTITVAGLLEPKSSVEEIDSPVTGVVSEVFVEDGQFVKSGTPLVEINSKGLSRRRDAVNTTIEILQAQNSSLARILSSDGNLESLPVLAAIPVGVDEPLRSKLVTAIDQSREILARLRQIDQRIISKSKTLEFLQIIQSDLLPLYEEGVVSRIQYLRQSNNVQERKAELVALREERSSVLGAVAGRINSINRDLENLQS